MYKDAKAFLSLVEKASSNILQMGYWKFHHYSNRLRCT